MIGWRHLKLHNITTVEYKASYGEVVSEEFRKAKQAQGLGKNKGNTPHNKGIAMSNEQKLLLSTAALVRNQAWRETNSHPVTGLKRTTETKEKIRQKRASQVITSEQVQKAINTKRRSGNDLAVFRGKTHSIESRKKISISSKKAAAAKTLKSITTASSRLEENGYTLSHISGNIATIKCHRCNNSFTRTRQYMSPGKISTNICPYCYPAASGTSIQEQEVVAFLSTYNISVYPNTRNVISPKEIDIFLPEYNLGIEYNGLYWHSNIYKSPNYHQEKTELASQLGLQLIHIFEDEWVNNTDIVKSRLQSLIGRSDNKIFARKCQVREVDSKTANQFLKQTHLQGTGRSNIRIGLYYNDQLVSLMTFLNNDISKNVKGWELNRFCSVLNTNIIGSAGKLFSYFVKKYNPELITSFSDRRWSNETAVYSKLGFEFIHNTVPNYWYFMPSECKRYHRYSLRKPANSILSEKQLREQQGYLRIYDCGSTRWQWSSKKAV